MEDSRPPWLRRLLRDIAIPSGYLRKWIPLSISIGLVAGSASIIFTLILQWFTGLLLLNLTGLHPPTAAGEGGEVFSPPSNVFLIPVVTTIGGLISGVLVYSFSPESEGHGTDAVIHAAHYKNGEIRSRVPLVKMLASAITIGSGGSAGREGPIALVGAGIGSLLGRIFRLSASDRRLAAIAGLGGGVGSIFKAPLGGAIFATEILYMHDFETHALVPAFISSVVAYSVYASVFGTQPIFAIEKRDFVQGPSTLAFYAVLGLLCGLVGISYVRAFYSFRGIFRRINVPRHLKPALGGLLVGVIGMVFPYVLGVGYGWIQIAVSGDLATLPIIAIIAMIPLKIIATSLTVGSGGSGGVFAPSLVIGGMVGAAVWAILNEFQLTSGMGPAAFIIVGMMSFFGGVGKVPVAVILMVSEMTGTYSLLVPSMISTAIAYIITGRFSIYEWQVGSRAESPAHQARMAVPLLHRVTVRDAMTPSVVSIGQEATLSHAAAMLSDRGVKMLPVIDSDRKLLGVVSFVEVLGVDRQRREVVRVKEVMRDAPVVTYPDEPLYEALKKMLQNKLERLPVVESPSRGVLVGILTRGDIMRLYERTLQEDIDLNHEPRDFY